MNTYEGKRAADGFADQKSVKVNGRRLRLRLDLWNHSPTGFEWGYGGSGPAQLALAILAHELNDDERAVVLHERFKRDVICRLDRAGFVMSSDDIAAWLERDDGN